jgi:hypothetical protein
MRVVATTIAFLALVGTAAADKKSKSDDADKSEGGTGEDPANQLVLMNAAAKLGDIGKIDRVRRVLDSRGMLRKLPERLEAALDGRNIAITDLDAIKDAYAQFDAVTALKLIEANEARILQNAAAGDPVPALAQLSEWRGMIAAQLEHDDEAVNWFRAAYRFNPAWAPDRRLASPRVRGLAKKARTESTQTGKLRVDADPEDAKFSVDGHDTHAASEKVELTAGMHLIVVTAPDRKPYAELVEIRPNKTEKMPISLEKESQNDRAARLVDETVAAPPGPARLKSARKLSKVTGVTRILMIEDGNDDHISVRVYDLDAKKVSKQFNLQGTESSAVIARIVTGALDPESMIDAQTVVVVQRDQPKKWYEHWYVWAAVGAVAIGGIGGYEYFSRGPTSVRGFQ